MQNYCDRLADAKAHLKKQSSQLGEKHLSVADAALAVGLLMQGNGDYRAAHQYFAQALDIRKCVIGSLDETIAQCYYYIGKNQYEQEDFEAAEISYKLCLECFGDRPEDNFLATVLNGMAFLYHDRDKFQVAEPILKRALAIRVALLDAWSPEIAESLDHLGWLYSEHGYLEEAENSLFVPLRSSTPITVSTTPAPPWQWRITRRFCKRQEDWTRQTKFCATWNGSAIARARKRSEAPGARASQLPHCARLIDVFS